MTIFVGVPSEVLEYWAQDARTAPDVAALRELLVTQQGPLTVVLGAPVPMEQAAAVAGELRLSRPEVGFVLVRDDVSAAVMGEALRAGLREVVPSGEPAALQEAVQRSDELSRAMTDLAHAHDPMDEPAGRVVTIFSAKGGCGKTTMATNLAAALADGGRRSVVIVDLDLAFGDVAIALQLFPSHTIADAVPMGEADLDFEAVQSLLTSHSAGLTALVAPLEPGAAESIPATLVSKILLLLREHYDYVVVDTPPAFDDQVLAAFDLSDSIILMATLDIPALKNLKLTLETLDMLNYPRDRWSIVLNRSDSKVGLAITEVETTLRTPITAQVPSSRDVPASINRGVPIVLDSPKHAVSLAIKEFAENHLAARGAAAAVSKVSPPLRSDRRGFLRRRARA